MTETQLVELWGKCLDVIADNIPEPAFKTWFAATKPASYANKVLTIFVPSQFVYEHIEENYVDLLGAVIYRVFGAGTQLNHRRLTDRQNRLNRDQVLDKTTRQTCCRAEEEW